MMGILQVASYIYKRYMDDFGVRIDEMKLRKHPTPILAVWTISATFAPC